MKILILGANQRTRYNWGHQLFKDEIAKQNNARFYGPGHKKWVKDRVDIRSILSALQFQPDVILSYMGKYCKWVKGLDESPIPKAHIVIDYAPWNYSDEDIYIQSTRPDLVFAVCRHEVESLQRNGHMVPIQWLPLSVDTEVFRYGGQAKDLDVSAVFSVVSWAYPSRSDIIKTLQGMGKPYRVMARASWPKTRLLHKDYVDMMSRSRISVNGVGIRKSLNWKFLEPCACGAMLLTEEADDMRRLGFVAGQNCVTFKSVPEMREKIVHYSKNKVERNRIAANGFIHVAGSHSNEIRVGQMMSMIRNEFGMEDK